MDDDEPLRSHLGGGAEELAHRGLAPPHLRLDPLQAARKGERRGLRPKLVQWVVTTGQRLQHARSCPHPHPHPLDVEDMVAEGADGVLVGLLRLDSSRELPDGVDVLSHEFIVIKKGLQGVAQRAQQQQGQWHRECA